MVITAVANTAVGAQALVNNTGSDNTATGFSSLLSNTTGNSNTANGAFALSTNTTAVGNTAIGDLALMNNDSSGKRQTRSVTRQLALSRSSLTLMATARRPSVLAHSRTVTPILTFSRGTQPSVLERSIPTPPVL